jgi:hypothetical protein
VPKESLLEAMGRIPDPRRFNKSHPLPAVLALCVCGMLCGCKSLLAIHQWGRERGLSLAQAFGFTRPVPCVATLSAILRLVPPALFERVLSDWFAGFAPVRGAKHGRRQVGVDGKTLRAMQGHADLPGLALVAAFAIDQGIVLDQEAMVASDELGAVRRLLERMPLEGVLISGDAQQTQRDVSTTIVQKKGPTSSPSRPTSASSSARLRPRSTTTRTPRSRAKKASAATVTRSAR